MLRLLLAAVVALAASFSAPAGHAQDTIKIGIIMPYSGQFADTAAQMDNAIKLYVKQHGDTVAGKKIEFVRKDTGGIAPDIAKRLAQELIVRDHADILAGFVLTPNALAAADVSAQAKKFMVVMNAATSIITTKSPYLARTSTTTRQLGDLAVGIITCGEYDYNLNSPLNHEFVKAYNAEFKRNPDFFSIGGYDGMHLIYEALKKTGGKTDGDSLIEAAKGMRGESPRGLISIDPETRDIIQNVYIRRVEKVGDVLVNVEFDKVENVKDPVKERMKH